MKKILSLIVLIVTLQAAGQPTTRYANMPSEISWFRGHQKTDSSHRLPLDTLASALDGSEAVKNGVLYVKYGRWYPVANPITYPAGLTDYSVNFHKTSFTDSTLVNSLISTTAYFNHGLVLNGNASVDYVASYLSAWNYGFIASENYTQRLLFQVLDSSNNIEMGIGVRGGQLTTAIHQISYITGVIGDSSITYLKSTAVYSSPPILKNGTAGSTSGILINKGDLIELSSTMVALDSVVCVFRNLTNGTTARVVRVGGTLNAAYTNVMGYPTIYFTKGHVRLINYAISKPDYDYIFFGNSITAGFYANDIDSAMVGQLKRWTASSISNSASSGATTADLLKLKEEIKFKNKIVFLSGINGNDPSVSYDSLVSHANYAEFVRRLKANNNRVIHIDNPYRNLATWGSILPLNTWIDTSYSAIDTVIKVGSLLTYPGDYFDTAHPNQSGHSKLAAKILQSVPTLFERQTGLYLKNQYATRDRASGKMDTINTLKAVTDTIIGNGSVVFMPTRLRLGSKYQGFVSSGGTALYHWQNDTAATTGSGFSLPIEFNRWIVTPNNWNSTPNAQAFFRSVLIADSTATLPSNYQTATLGISAAVGFSTKSGVSIGTINGSTTPVLAITFNHFKAVNQTAATTRTINAFVANIKSSIDWTSPGNTYAYTDFLAGGIGAQTGTFTNRYGYYCAPVNTGSSRPWAFYSEGTTDRNYFGGTVMIGDTTVANLSGTPEKLYVSGNTKVSGFAANSVATATDANLTMTTQVLVLAQITANRVLTMPSVPNGTVFYILNPNSSGFSWTTTAALVDHDNTPTTTLTNQTNYTVVYDGTSYRIVNKY